MRAGASKRAARARQRRRGERRQGFDPLGQIMFCRAASSNATETALVTSCGLNATTSANPNRNGRRRGPTRPFSPPATTIRGPNITCSRCSRIRPGASTWAMSAITRWATWSRATSARAASTCCTRWAGTRSACRPRTRRCRTPPIPRKWTYANIAAMRAQLKSMGLSLDWSREVATCDPELLRSPAEAVPRLPRRRAGRAQEVEGQLGPGRQHRARQRAGDRRPRLALRRRRRAARADAMVPQDQRLFRRAARARSITLDRWPEKVRLMQRNWIGRSEGMLVRFAIDPASRGPLANDPEARELEIYTTRPDTLFGAKFMAIVARPSAGDRRGAPRSEARRLHRGVPQDRHVGGGDRDGGEEGLRHRAYAPSIRSTPTGSCRSTSPISS